MPSTLGRLSLTGKTMPPNGLLTRFQITLRPTLPGVSVAPITATACGAKKTSIGRARSVGRMALGSLLAGLSVSTAAPACGCDAYMIPQVCAEHISARSRAGGFAHNQAIGQDVLVHIALSTCQPCEQIQHGA